MDDQSTQQQGKTEDTALVADIVSDVTSNNLREEDKEETSTFTVNEYQEPEKDGVEIVDTGNQVAYLQNLQNSINLQIARIEQLKEEMTPVKEMINSILENDPMYLELDQKAKDAATEKGKRKKELMSLPQAKTLVDKLRTLSEDLKEVNSATSQYLAEYKELTGSNEFEGRDGELRQIVFNAKLVRKTNLNS